MLRKSSQATIVVACLVANSSALKFRPPPGSVPWKKKIKLPSHVDPSKEHDIDYFVPNFGEDNDVMTTKQNLKAAEEQLGHVMYEGKNKTELLETFRPAKLPYELFDVPHFGEDDDIKTTKKNLKEAEESLGHEMEVEDPKPMKIPPVPHFGEDQEIKDTKTNLNLAEKMLNTTLSIPEPPKRELNYFVPNFGQDEDVNDTTAHLAEAEKTLNHKLKVKRDGDGSYELIQTESDLRLESDPICSSAGCDQYQHPKKALGYEINYPVPNFGRDHEINTNYDSLDIAQKQLGHTWVWKDPPKADPVFYTDSGPLDGDMMTSLKNLKEQEAVHGAWNLPPESFVQLEQTNINKKELDRSEDAQNVQINSDITSDPICNSAGCTQYKHKTKPLGYDINYPVPNFGRDHDINANFESLDIAQKSLDHVWVFPKKLPKGPPPVLYNDGGPLDGDMMTTLKNLKDQEAVHGSWDLPPKDYAGVQLQQQNINKKELDRSEDQQNIQINSEVSSDPICSSAGCTQYKHKHKALGYDIDYFVPHFGEDTDISDSKSSLTLAENMIGRKFDFPNAKWKKPKAVKYVKEAPFDEEVIDTQKNLADAESQLGHTWNIGA